jgi:hypothetical protein
LYTHVVAYRAHANRHYRTGESRAIEETVPSLSFSSRAGSLSRFHCGTHNGLDKVYPTIVLVRLYPAACPRACCRLETSTPPPQQQLPSAWQKQSKVNPHTVTLRFRQGTTLLDTLASFIRSFYSPTSFRRDLHDHRAANLVLEVCILLLYVLLLIAEIQTAALAGPISLL